MADVKSEWNLRRLAAFHLILYLLIVIANGLEERDEGYTSGKNLISEFFLPINGPVAVMDAVKPRDRREVEGSGDESDFSEIRDRESEDVRGSTEVSLNQEKTQSNVTDSIEGSGDHDDVRETDKSTENVLIIGDSEILTTTPEISTTEATTIDQEVANESTTVNVLPEKDSYGTEESSTVELVEKVVTTTMMTPTEESSIMGIVDFVSTVSTSLSMHEEASVSETTIKPLEETTAEHSTTPTAVPAVVNEPEAKEFEPESPSTEEKESEEPDEPASMAPPDLTTLTSAQTPQTDEPVMEPVFTETKLVHKSLEASPGNIIQKKNISVGVDPQLIVTDMDPTESEAQMDETVSRKLGAYIVIALILLSFSSLVGYIMLRKRQHRKRRRDFEGNQESHDTEKALLSLSDYKDHTELEENHLKNNEITPIVVKSNSQINRFEKNTNFSSPKNLNTVATEKNVEKDNVLKSTTENLGQVTGGPVTQAIIEESAEKESADEDKNSPNMEKLIVKTRIDQDSIPKKPIIINRSSTGYVPIPQDNS